MGIRELSIENFINTNEYILYKVKGKSMEPMLRSNMDLVYIRKKHNYENFQENDIVLYKRRNKLILHRIVKVNGHGYYDILGDNSSRKDKKVSNGNILGILEYFYRDGVKYSMDNPIYRDYVKRTRNSQLIRTKKKYIYDLIVYSLRFLPPMCLIKTKSFLKLILHYKYTFKING